MGRSLIFMLLLIGAIGGYVAIQSHRVHRAEDTARSAKGQIHALQAELAAERLKERVVTRYVDRVRIVRERGATITREIPVYVTAQADARCDVPAGFVRVHDAAAHNQPLGEPAGNPDAPAAGITLSAVAETVADNYGTCHEIREQLIGLQDYVRGLQAIEPP